MSLFNSIMASSKPAGGGGTSPIDPVSIGSIWAAYEAEAYSQGDGSAIATNWTDRSGNARTALYSGSWTFETNELNGLPVLRSAVPNGEFAVPNMSALTEGSSLEICKVILDANGASLFGTDSNSSHYPYSNGLIYDKFGTTVRKDGITPGVTMTNWHSVYWWSKASDWGMKQNWADIHTTATNTVGFPASPLIWGNGGTNQKGDLAARYIWSAKLTAPQLAGVAVWVFNKWGI